MPLRPEAATGLAEELIGAHSSAMEPHAHHGKVKRYLRGEHDLPYMPRGAKAEYVSIARKSITNWLPLVADTFSKGLWVDGYRGAKETDNARPWAFWQANGLDARQSIPMRGALEYGASYMLVLPGQPAPLMRPLSPTRSLAFYEDVDDEWPVHALYRRGATASGDRLWQLFDRTAVYDIVQPKESTDPIRLVGMSEHGLGVTPWVRFRDRLDGEARGIIAPLFTLQDRINEAVFSLMIALQYASFRQRWATGLAIPVDDDENSPTYGQAIEPFEAAVDRLWVSDSSDAKFGDFAQTDVSGHLTNYESAVKTLAAIAQTPPTVLLGDIVNIGTEALAAVHDSTQRKINEYETIFGESWEQGFRLAALAAGDREAATDTGAQVRWRDTEARSLAATVDALGKMTQMLMVPPEVLWARIPGVTDQDVRAWKEAAGRTDGLAALASALQQQSADVAADDPAA